MKNVLADTGVWYALFDPRDCNYNNSQDINEMFNTSTVVVPWPTVYETLRTRFVKNTKALNQFEIYLKSPRIYYIDDANYRDAAFELSLESSLRGRRPLSMVDCLIRLVLDDSSNKIDALATFNCGDFFDICKNRRIAIISS